MKFSENLRSSSNLDGRTNNQNKNKNMYIKHSTKVPVQLSNETIKKVMENHYKILNESVNIDKENTDDAKWTITKSSTIPEW